MTEDSAAPLVTVRLLELPLELQLKAQQHSDELIRELTLIAEQLRAEGEVQALPPRLVAMVEELAHRYGGFAADAEERVERAMADGQQSIDVEMRLPASVGPAARHLGEVLDEADEYCRAGQHLLTLATPPDALAYRRWYLAEIARQAAGEEPVSWTQFNAGPSSG